MVWILYETGMTVSATGLRLNLKEVFMSDNVDNRCLQFVAAPVQICGGFFSSDRSSYSDDGLLYVYRTTF